MTEEEMDRLDDTVNDGMIARNEVMEKNNKFKSGIISVDELIGIWSNDEDDDEY